MELEEMLLLKEEYLIELETKLEMTRLALEDFVLESDHLSSCEYNNGFGNEYECKCMDRKFYNKIRIMIRAKEVLASLVKI